MSSDSSYTDPPFPLTSIDRHLLSIPDSQFTPISWPHLTTIITSNTLEDLKRRPSDLRRYIAWSSSIKAQYGGITAFVIQQRLTWTPLASNAQPGGQNNAASPTFEHYSEIPFEDERDYAILKNDWPYGFEEGIEHLLVWSKTPIEVREGAGDVTDRARGWIEDFVERTFAQELKEWGAQRGDEKDDGEKRVLWFKNWVSLQSVRGVDHVHVLVRDAPPELLEKWTRRKDL